MKINFIICFLLIILSITGCRGAASHPFTSADWISAVPEKRGCFIHSLLDVDSDIDLRDLETGFTLGSLSPLNGIKLSAVYTLLGTPDIEKTYSNGTYQLVYNFFECGAEQSSLNPPHKLVLDFVSDNLVNVDISH